MCSNQPPDACHELSSSSTPARATAAKVSGMMKRLPAAVMTTVGREALLGEQTHELDRLVDGDAAAHAHEHVALRQVSSRARSCPPCLTLSPCS